MHYYITDAAGVLQGPVELPIVPGIGVQIPGNGIALAEELPAAADGHVWTLTEGAPQQIEDNRGDYYSTVDGRPVQLAALGPVPDNLTATARPTPYDVWTDGAWTRDTAAELSAQQAAALAQRSNLQLIATQAIAPLQDAADLDMATAEEAAALLAWKRYRVELSRIDQQPGYPANIEWPAVP